MCARSLIWSSVRVWYIGLHRHYIRCPTRNCFEFLRWKGDTTWVIRWLLSSSSYSQHIDYKSMLVACSSSRVCVSYSSLIVVYDYPPRTTKFFTTIRRLNCASSWWVHIQNSSTWLFFNTGEWPLHIESSTPDDCLQDKQIWVLKGSVLTPFYTLIEEYSGRS
jgi:hypothetical protein